MPGTSGKNRAASGPTCRRWSIACRSLAPSDQFLFWAHPLAPRPLSAAGNTQDVTIGPGPNSPWPVLWPRRYFSFDVDVFHSPHNIMSRGLPCPAVVTVHDVMAIDRPGLHLRGLERLALSLYYPQAVWRALREAGRLIVPTAATADRVLALAPDAGPRLRVIWDAPDSCFQPAPDPEHVRRRVSGAHGNRGSVPDRGRRGPAGEAARSGAGGVRRGRAEALAARHGAAAGVARFRGAAVPAATAGP